MKKTLLAMLICPRCLPEEHRLQENIVEEWQADIIAGTLHCRQCGKVYQIRQGIAFLNPDEAELPQTGNRYETMPLLSSYLWSHFGDLLADDQATDAYSRWAQLMQPSSGACLDTGSAVGRFSFDMAKKFDFVVGIDNSVSFIRASRDLMRHRQAALALPEEGVLTRPATLTFPEDWKTDNIEFIVGDAQALPFRTGAFAAVSSLNVVDKVARPLAHLTEINRVARVNDSQLLFSDPFSWSKEAAAEADWLGGTARGPFAGRGRDNIIALLEGEKGALSPSWKVEADGHIWWKIRTHSNHFEMIRSCFVKASR